MRISRGATLLFATTAFGLVGCSEKPPTCSDPSSVALALSLFRDEATTDASKEKDGSVFLASTAWALGTIRSTAIDEKIGKSTCTAELTVTVPKATADKMRWPEYETAWHEAVPQGHAVSNDSGINLAMQVDYEIQRTDDKKQLVVTSRGYQAFSQAAASLSNFAIVADVPHVAASGPAPFSISFAPVVQSDSLHVIEEGRTALRAMGGKAAFEGSELPQVKMALIGLLGQDISDFQDRISGPGSAAGINVDGEYASGSACMAHNCGSASAAYAVNLSTGMLYVVIQQDDRSLKVFGASSRDGLPPELQKFIASIESGA